LRSLRPEIRRTLVTIVTAGVVVVIALLLWEVSQVVLVVFAASLFAILLDSLAQAVPQRFGLPRAPALAIVVLLVLGALAGFGWVAGPQAGDQIAQLGQRLPGAIAQLRDAIESHSWGRVLLANTPAPQQLVPSSADLLGRISGVFSTALGAIVNVGLILVIGVYLAVDPGVYVRGFTLLVPPASRDRAEAILRAIGNALRWWLVGRVVAMVAVGALTGLGLWLIDMPLALALAIIAGLLSFIPFVGPVLSAAPAVLIALAEDPLMALWVVVIYIVIQLLEGNLITPQIEQRAVSLPPAVLLTSQLLMGVLLGFLGLLLATPLVVVVIVLTQMIYVQGMLGDPVRVLGQHEREGGKDGQSAEPIRRAG
jgi:predicted PurR-regulated permease PerM